MFEIVSKDRLRAWIWTLTKGEQRALADYCEIPMSSFRRYRNDSQARFSQARQVRMSKAMALWEAGQLAAVGPLLAEAVVPVAQPKPRAKYQIAFTRRGPRLTPALRPALPVELPNPLLKGTR